MKRVSVTDGDAAQSTMSDDAAWPTVAGAPSRATRRRRSISSDVGARQVYDPNQGGARRMRMASKRAAFAR